MVALLFLFMPLTTDDTHGVVAIDRPFARNATLHPRSLREDSMHLTITRDGKFFFGSTGGTYQTGISIEELAPRLRDATKNAPSKELYLDADARCRYIDVEIAIDQLSAAGITNLVILTENPRTPSTPTQ
jgi:biopolymer transport protein ExbD